MGHQSILELMRKKLMFDTMLQWIETGTVSILVLSHVSFSFRYEFNNQFNCEMILQFSVLHHEAFEFA